MSHKHWPIFRNVSCHPSCVQHEGWLETLWSPDQRFHTITVLWSPQWGQIVRCLLRSNVLQPADWPGHTDPVAAELTAIQPVVLSPSPPTDTCQQFSMAGTRDPESGYPHLTARLLSTWPWSSTLVPCSPACLVGSWSQRASIHMLPAIHKHMVPGQLHCTSTAAALTSPPIQPTLDPTTPHTLTWRSVHRHVCCGHLFTSWCSTGSMHIHSTSCIFISEWPCWPVGSHGWAVCPHGSHVQPHPTMDSFHTSWLPTYTYTYTVSNSQTELLMGTITIFITQYSAIITWSTTLHDIGYDNVVTNIEHIWDFELTKDAP